MEPAPGMIVLRGKLKQELPYYFAQSPKMSATPVDLNELRTLLHPFQRLRGQGANPCIRILLGRFKCW